MNKLVLISFLLVCVGCALAGYGSGTPGYYDPWTYYGGYDRYYGRGRYQPQRYYPIRYNDNYNYYNDRYQPRGDYYYGRGRGGNYNPISYYDSY